MYINYLKNIENNLSFYECFVLLSKQCIILNKFTVMNKSKRYTPEECLFD